MENKVSVIVPIYNVEKELKRCLESLINQLYPNLEILLIDDGSLDNSGQIASSYSELDSRVNYYKKTNGGLSDARNYGIKKATGTYILFVDSDDFIEIEAIKILVEVMERDNLDIVLGNAVRVEGGFQTKLLHSKGLSREIMSGEEYFSHALTVNQYAEAVWLNLYKAEIIKDNNLYFVKGQLHEDINWTPKVLLNAKKVRFLDYPFYQYVIRENSITQQKDLTKNIIHKMQAIDDLEEYYKKNSDKINPDNIGTLKKHLITLYLSSYFLESEKKPNINKAFLIRNAKTMGAKIRVALFLIHPSLYSLVQRSMDTFK